jgi:hypothetical protein
MGYYNIWKNTYDLQNQLTSLDVGSKNNTFPVFGLYYTFVPSGTPLLGLNLRLFDTRVTMGGWIKVFEFAPENVLRLEATVITEPFSRSLRTWESTGGFFFQLRYRYGL